MHGFLPVLQLKIIIPRKFTVLKTKKINENESGEDTLTTSLLQ